MRALPGPKVRREMQRPRLDPMALLWLLMPLELTCGSLTAAIGWWTLIPAGLLVVLLVALVAWSTWDES